MTTSENKHRRNAETLLDHADDMVEKADHLQASEKIWGTVAHTLKEIADRHGWKDESNTDLSNIAGYLAVIADDKKITEGFRDARVFHTNFYEDEFPLDQIKDGVKRAAATVALLYKAEKRYEAGVRPANGATSPFMYYNHLRRDDMNANQDALRAQGLSNYEATTAARIINAARRSEGNVEDLSFRIGANRRRVSMGGDGKPKVGKAAPPRRITAVELTTQEPQPRRRKGYWQR